MRASFRTKLFAVVAAIALPFIALVVSTYIIDDRVDTELGRIEQRYLPRLENVPKLAASFDALGRSFQDAVAAHDIDSLERSRSEKDALLDVLHGARGAFDATDAAAFNAAIEAWYRIATDVVRRLIAGETGEGIVDAMAEMQAKRAAARVVLDRMSAFDRRELTTAFADARHAQATGRRVHIIVTIVCVSLVLLFVAWITRNLVSSLDALTAGFARFGRGDFETLIVADTSEELGKIATHANAMAKNLEAFVEEQKRAAATESALANLAKELRGELAPAEVAERAVRFVARTLETPCAVLYVVDDDGVLNADGRYGIDDDTTTKSFKLGNGLVGQAAREETITVLRDPPEDYVRACSGLGESPPRALVFVPLTHDAKVSGVLELATFEPWTDEDGALVGALRETIAVAIEVARARMATRTLLERSERLTAKLTVQEEELRARNEELGAQQEELRQTNEELTEYMTQLEEQRSELEAAREGLEVKARELTTVSAYKSQFLANMSHELRTPLNSMLLLSKLLADNAGSNLTEKQVEWAQTIHAAGSDLLALINDVLDLAKVEAGKQNVHSKEVDLARVAAHAERVFSPLAQKKGLAFEIHIAKGTPPTIATDEQRLMQILTNLVGNAIKFTEKGSVVVSVSRAQKEGMIAFEVRDTGEGIPQAHQERIFAPFEQVDGAVDRRHGGTGLGLTIAREIAALLGGELQLTSTVGEGSTFTLLLPLIHTESVTTPKRTSAADEALSKLPRDADYILVIEDDRTFASIAGGIVEEHGLASVSATDGETGLAIAAHRRPRGIVLDVRLPGVDGWTVMERLRSDPALATVPVHFVSAVDGETRGRDMGAVGWLTKPASREGLVGVVESLLTNGKAPIKVLVVAREDESAARAQSQLRREGLTVRRVTSGAAALSALEAEPFSCVILDWDLPDEDGIALVEKIAAKTPVPPAIVVTTSRPLDRAAAQRLEKSAIVVVRDGAYENRLIDEIRLFVRRVREGLAPGRDTPSTFVKDARLQGRRVLVVDDDMRTLYALSATLRAKGMHVFSADTGKAALSTLASEPAIDVVLMDIMMPEMDGYEAMRRIRSDARWKNVPIVALTAKAMKGDREKCIEAGATDYLPKPVDVDRLLALVMSLIDSTSRVHATS